MALKTCSCAACGLQISKHDVAVNFASVFVVVVLVPEVDDGTPALGRPQGVLGYLHTSYKTVGSAGVGSWVL